MTETRPREYAFPIIEKVEALIRAELELVPKEFKTQVADLVVNGLAIDWELRKSEARKK